VKLNGATITKSAFLSESNKARLLTKKSNPVITNRPVSTIEGVTHTDNASLDISCPHEISRLILSNCGATN
jgi:hypothetical protein